jgi:tetratricopeptide (TPR) repeat protein
MPSNNLWSELRRRKVVRVTVAYAVIAWVLLQVGDTVFGLLEFPSWAGQALVWLLLLGLPLAVILSWIFDISPEGLVVSAPLEEVKSQTFSYGRVKDLDVKSLGLAEIQLPVLVGRQAERDAIHKRLEAAREGQGSILLISGEPGIGKTRLGDEALRRGMEMGFLPLAGHAYEEQSGPYIVATEIIEEMTRILPSKFLRNVLGPAAPEIARLVPDLRLAFPDIPKAVELPAEQQQRYLFNAILELLGRLCQASPVVMLFDDLHWADQSSMQLLSHLAPQVVRLPVLIVITYRDSEMDMSEPFKRGLAILNKLSFVSRLALRQLSLEEVSRLLAARNGESAPEPLVQLIHRETQGNAFFVQSVFQHLIEEGVLYDEDGAWRSDVDIETLAVPDSIRLVTDRRFGRLGQEAQGVLEMAAVIGLRFRVKVLEAALPDRDTVPDAIEAAERAQLIKPSVSGSELRYEFVHALARQTLLSRLSALRLRRHHHTLVAAIEEVDADRLESRAADLAHHSIEAGELADSGSTLHWLLLAGDRARASAAMGEAVQYFDTALSLLHEAGSELEADLLQRRGAAQLSLGEKESFLADLLAAYAIFKALQNGKKAASVVLELSYMMVWNAEPAEAMDLIGEAFGLLSEEESDSMCRLLSAQGMAHSMANELAQAQRSHTAAVNIARKLDIPGLLAESLQNRALMQWLIVDGAIERSAHEAAAIRREQKQEWSLGQCLWMEQAGLVFQGRFAEALAIDEELPPLATRNEDYGSLAISAMMRGLAHQAGGRVRASVDAFRTSVDLFEKGGFPWGYISHGHLSVNLLLLGDYAAARKAFELAGANALPGISWSGADTCYWLSGKAQLGDADILEAFQSLEPGLPSPGEVISGGELLLLEGSIEALIECGEEARAAGLYPLIRGFLDRNSSLLTFTYGLHQRFAGMAAAAGGDWMRAETHYEKALKQADKLPHRVDQARARYWYARMLKSRAEPGDLDRARALSDRALELGLEMKLRGFVESVEALGMA